MQAGHQACGDSGHAPANLWVSQQMMTGRPQACAAMAMAAEPTRDTTVPLDMTAAAPSSTLVASCTGTVGGDKEMGKKKIGKKKQERHPLQLAGRHLDSLMDLCIGPKTDFKID